MVKKWVLNVVRRKNNISDADAVVLEYGLSKIFLFLEDAVLTMILGYLMGIIVESIMFQGFYTLLRMYAGGYHADTERKCKIYSGLVTVASLTTIRFLPGRVWLLFFIALIASIVVAVLSPVEAANKPLSDAERGIYHRKTVMIVAVADLILLLSMVLGIDAFFKPLMVGLLIVCFLMIIGVGSDKRLHKIRP